MASEHVMFGEEITWGEDVPMEHAVPVETASVNPAQPLMVNEDTGGGRGRRPGTPGEMTVSGPINMKLYPQTIGWMLRTMYGAKASVAAGTGWKNKFLPDDDVDFDSLTLEKRYGPSSPKGSETIRGSKLNGYTVSCRAREFAKIATDWIAKDAAVTGSTFPNGDAAPAPTDPDPLYLASQADALRFNQGVMRVGSTSKTLTAGEIVIVGGVDACEFDNVSIQIANNLSNDGFGVCLSDNTVQQISEGPRNITVSFDADFAIVGFDYYKQWVKGLDAVIELFFEGPVYNTTFRHQYKWTLPLVRYSAAANPELNAAYGLKRVTVQGTAYADPAINNLDHGLVIQTTENYAA